MSFRRRLSLFLVLTLVVIQLLTGFSVYHFLRARLIDQGEQELVRQSQVFVRQLDALGRQIAEGVRILSLDYGLRQAVAQHDHDTLISVLRNHGARIHTERMLLVGLDGAIELDTSAPDAAKPLPFWFPGMITRAVEDGHAAAVAAIGGKAYWLVLVPVMAPEPIGFIGACLPLDDRLLAEMRGQGALPEAITLLTEDTNHHWQRASGTGNDADLNQELPPPGTTALVHPVLAMVKNGADVLLAERLHTPAGSPAVASVLDYPIEAALAQYRPMFIDLSLLLGLGLGAALFGAMLIARGVAKPIEALAAQTRRIEAGDYTPPRPIAKTGELGALSTALSAMAVAISEREDHIRRAGQAAERAAVLEAATRLLTDLGAAGQQITANLNADAVFAGLRHHLASLLGAPILRAYRFDPDQGGLLVPVFATEQETAAITLADPTSPAARAARERQSLLEGPALYGPLIAGDQLLGVLAIETGDRHDFAERDRLILRTLSAYGAVALDNARAYRDLDTTLARLRDTMAEREYLQQLQDKDLSFARDLQIGTLPASTVYDLGAYRVSIEARMDALKEVGGDFYDFIRIAPDRLLFAVGDASGKGVPAAMFTSMARSSLLTVSRQDMDPALMLADVNRFLAANNPSLMFVTMMVGILDLATGRLIYASAGHPYAQIAHADGTVTSLEAAQGMAVGIDETEDYLDATWQMQPGDRLIAFSDGISEAENREGALYGEDRLARCFGGMVQAGTEDLITGILADVTKFADGQPAGDDITLLLLTYERAGSDKTGS